MAKGKKEDSPPCFQKYGIPIYGAFWVPTKNLSFSDQTEEATESTQARSWLVFGGGGGEGRSGIPNSLLLAQYEPSSDSLSPSPITKFGTGEELPYRMAVHPTGDGVICSFPKSCRLFEWDVLKHKETHKLDLKSSDKVLTKLEDVGQQLGLTFSADGSALAVGGEDGHLRVFKWPSMEVILDEADAYTTVKDLSFSSDAKFLVSLGSGGPCRVWDTSSSKIVASLPKGNDELFGSCRFAQTSDDKDTLYIVAMRDQGGSIIRWDTTSWKRVGSRHIVRDPISAFGLSADGKLLAVGTIPETYLYWIPICILDSNMWVHTLIRKAHLGLVTTLMFSLDFRTLVSASLDSSARVTLIENKKKQSGPNIWIILVIFLLAILVYFQKNK